MRTDTLPFRAPAATPAAGPDPGYAARAGLARLRDELHVALRTRAPRRPWGEPPVFFFDPARQAELDAARETLPAGRHPLDARVAAALPTLVESVEARRVARAVPGLREAAAALAPRLPAAKDLHDLLAVPDDEVLVALDPARGLGARVLVRGVADVAQLHALLAEVAPELLDHRPPTAADPGVGEAHWQLYRPAALRPDGSLPSGMSGHEHWLWWHEPLAAVPLVGGERLVLLAPPAYPAAWEARGRFPGLSASAEKLEALGPTAVTARLGKLLGRPLPARPALARVA